MSTVTIADRRAIMTKSILEPDFRDLLQRDPRAAIAKATGHSTPAGARVTVVEEQPDAWEFVVPSGAIDAELPSPSDARSMIENDVYALLRDDPAVRARVVSDPKGFLTEHFQLDLGPNGVNVREEQAGELLFILPHRDGREELHDEALEMVVGGDGVTAGCTMVGNYDKPTMGPRT